ncbi:MAG: ABC transporter ATP-binding protein, partial [Dolichospermum sp.]|jgi:ABC-2 type transport system ATP-binding protein
VTTNTPENLMTQLTGGAGYELEITGEAPLAKQMLQNISGVSLVESMPTHQHLLEDHTYLRVILQPGEEPGKEIASALIRAGFGLYEMRRISATLEDVFLELTTTEKNLPTNINSEIEEGEAA